MLNSTLIKNAILAPPRVGSDLIMCLLWENTLAAHFARKRKKR